MSRTGRAGRQLLRWVAGLVTGVLVLVAGLLLAVASFVLYPPSDLLRRAALPIAQEVLHHPNLHLGALDLAPLDHLELRDLWLGPPSGYGLPLFTVKRIAVRYDLSGIALGKLRVLQVQVERPIVRAEVRGGKLSWLAFLEGLPKSPPKPEEKSGPAPEIKVAIDRVSIIGLGAYFDDGQRRLALDGLHLALTGIYRGQSSHFDVGLRLEAPRPGEPNLAVLQRGPQPVGGRFGVSTVFNLSLDNLDLPQLRTNLLFDLDLSSVELRSAWPLAPLKLGARLRAHVSLPEQRAELERLSLIFNDTELLQLATGASLSGGPGATPQPHGFNVHLAKLYFPLDKLAPYAREIAKGVDFGGDVQLRDLRIAAELEEIKNQTIPRLSGEVILDRVWARVKLPGQQALLRDLQAHLVLAAGKHGPTAATSEGEILSSLPPLHAQPSVARMVESSKPAASVRLHGRVRVGLARAAGAEVRGLTLRLAGGANIDQLAPKLSLRGLGSRLSLDLPSVRYQHPQLGDLQLGLSTSLEAGGELAQRRFSLRNLLFALRDGSPAKAGNLLEATLNAQAEELGAKSFRAELDLRPIDLARMVRWLPAPLRRPLAGVRLGGQIRAHLRAQGRRPVPRTPPLRLPLDLDALVALSGISLDDPGRGLHLKDLGGDLTVKGKPSDLRLGLDLKIAGLSQPAQHLVLKDIKLPLSVHLLPTAVELDLGAKVGQAQKNEAGVTARGLDLSTRVRAALPLERLLAQKPVELGAARLDLKARVAGVRLAQPGSTLTLGGLTAGLDLTHAPKAKDPLRLQVLSRVESLSQAESAATVSGLGLRVETALAGPALRLPLALPEDGLSPRSLLALLQRIGLRVGVDLDHVRVGGVLDRPLQRSSLALEATLSGDETLELGKLALRAPSRGLELSLSGRVRQVLSAGLGPLPPFDLTARVGLDNPVARQAERATSLHPGLRAAGRLGLTLRARRLTEKQIQLDGRLQAKDFNFWQRAVTREEPKEGPLLSVVTLHHLKDLNADVPISQRVNLDLPRWSLPPPSRSIFESQSASVIYSSLQPFTGGRSRLTLGGFLREQQITATSREGYFLSTAKRRIAVDRVALDLSLADSTLYLSRLYLKLFGGDVTGEVQAQLVSLSPPDLRLRLRTQVTGVNLSYLDPEAKEHTEKTEVSALVDTKYWLSRQFVEGRVDITRLSPIMLDSLLGYLDPNKTNENVQENRKLINGRLAKLFKPRVKLVAVWINYGNLNMDIEMDAWSLAGTVIRRNLENNRIRRINILPFLPKPGEATRGARRGAAAPPAAEGTP